MKTRAQAKRDGDKYYFTGKECHQGHLSERFVSNGSCIECRQMDKSDHIGTHRIKLFIINHPGRSISNIATSLGFSEEHIRRMFVALNIPRSSKPENCVG